MGNFKVKVNSEAESREAQELFFELGYRWIDIGATYYKTSPNFNYLTAYFKGKTLAQGHGFDAEKEITLPELRAMVNDQYAEIEKVCQHRHYFIDVSDVDEIDFYEIALRYNVTDPCIQHILKKCLAVGQRGQKDFHHDLKDIYDTAKRMLDVHGLDS